MLGASFAGKKAMTATSGPGLSLMAELVGLAGMAEIPAVIVDAQRAGPSTGMPTKTEQSDLQPRPLRRPRRGAAGGDGADVGGGLLLRDVEAFNAAERYQVPVILLSDQSLWHRMETVRRPDFGRRSRWSSALRPTAGAERRLQALRARPRRRLADGDPGSAAARTSRPGIEHDEAGNPHYAPELHEAMQAKRFGKLDPLMGESASRFSGADRPTSGILGWGSTEGAAVEAAELCLDRGHEGRHLLPARARAAPGRADPALGARAWTGSSSRSSTSPASSPGSCAPTSASRSSRSRRRSGLPFTAQQIADYITDEVRRSTTLVSQPA